MRNHTRTYIGEFSIEELERLRKHYKELELSVRFRGRGVRYLDNHEDIKSRSWKTDLSLKYAERVAVYER